MKLPEELRDNLQITYLILSCSELLSHLNSLQGITYGQKEKLQLLKKEIVILVKEIKKRLLMGAYFSWKLWIFRKSSENYVLWLIIEWKKFSLIIIS